MRITFDPSKRERTLAERGLDFAQAAAVFNGDHLTFEDDRQDYGERRLITIGRLEMPMTVNSDATKTDWVDPDDAPELDEAWFEKADHHRGEVLVRRGRPKGADKVSTTIRFDADVLAAFKQDGAGWQTRMNQALRDWLAKKSAA